MLSKAQQQSHREAIARHHVNYGKQTRRFWTAATSAERDMADKLARWHSLEADRLLKKLHDDAADRLC
jgi:hypothetical protein